MYQYSAVVLAVIDGDTVDLDCDLGFDIRRKDRIRLYGINAPERNAPGGPEATAALRSMLPVGAAVVLDTYKDKTEKYGRYLGTISVGSPAVIVNDQMVADGHAVPYFGGKR
jgi:micrococcal nuclease